MDRALASGAKGCGFDSRLAYSFEVIKVIEKWGPFGINPFVVNPGLDPQLKTLLRDIFLNMDKDSRGQELLAEFMIDRFIVPDDSIYDSVREMRSYLQEQGLSR